MGRWDPTLEMLDRVASRSRAYVAAGGVARRAQADREVAAMREHLRFTGVDVFDRCEVLAVVAGAEAVVAQARALHLQGDIPMSVLACIDNTAELVVACITELLPEERR